MESGDVAEKGLVSSVMEYAPINIAPDGVEQGYYYTPTIGPYDYLAIEYAYKEINPATGETEESILNKIAEKAETQELAYGPDEDTYGLSIDPLANVFDLGRDPLKFAKQQAQLVKDTLPKLTNLTKEGEDYTLLRSAVLRMINTYFSSADFALKFIGGQYVRRVKKGGENDPLPLESVSAAKQREALDFLVGEMLSDKGVQIVDEITRIQHQRFINMSDQEKWDIGWQKLPRDLVGHSRLSVREVQAGDCGLQAWEGTV